MTIAVRCPQCSKRLGAPDEAQGREILCPHCQTTFRAVAEGPDSSGPASPRSTSAAKPAAPRPAEARPAAPRPAGARPAAPRPAVGRPPVVQAQAGEPPGAAFRLDITPTARAEGVEMHSDEGVWTARVPGELLATCPGIYLAGLALAYGLISLVGLGPPSINLLLLFIMGLLALAGWKISHYYYFNRWTDLATSGLPKEQTPQPWWLRGCMIAPGLTVAIAIALFMKGEESKKTRAEAYQRYASRADAKTVKEAVDRCHDECFDDAHVRILRKKHFSKTRYFELMDERMEMTFAIHDRVRQMVEQPPEPAIPARRDPPDPPRVHPADLINPAPTKKPIETVPTLPPTPTPQVDPVPKLEPLPKKPVTPAFKKPETVEEALAELASGEDRKVDLALLVLRSQQIAVVDEQRSLVSKKLLAVLDEGSQSDFEVLGALERWKADETPVELASRLAKTPERDRYALYDTLEKWKDPRTVDAIVAMMATDEKAGRTLQYFTAESEEPLIVHLKEHPDLKVRLAVCSLLSKFGGEKSLAALREVYKERPMQKAATESIRTIQRRPKPN